MAQQQDGFFDMRSADEILAQRRIDRRTQGGQMGQTLGFDNPSERAMANLGGTLGAAIANKYNAPVLSPQEQRRTQAIAMAGAQLKAYRAQTPDATIEDINLNSQRFMAENLLKAGDFEAGTQIATAYAQQKRAMRQADLEARKLDTEEKKNQQEISVGEMVKGSKTLTDVYREGDKYTDNPESVWIDADWNAHTKNGEVLPLGTYFKTPPPDPAKRGPGRPSDHGIGVAGASYLRNYATNIMQSASDYTKAAQLLSESAKSGSIEFLSASGKASNAATWFIDNTTALARTIEKALATDSGTTPDEQRVKVEGSPDDLSEESAALKYVEKDAELLNELENVMPANVRENTQLKARWASLMVRMADSTIRLAQPGTRQISAATFKNAVVALASSTTDPETFRRTAIDTMNSQIQGFRDHLKTYPRDALESVYGPELMDTIDKRMATWDAAYKESFGTAAKPGPGLTDSNSPEITEQMKNDAVRRALGR